MGTPLQCVRFFIEFQARFHLWSGNRDPQHKIYLCVCVSRVIETSTKFKDERFSCKKKTAHYPKGLTIIHRPIIAHACPRCGFRTNESLHRTNILSMIRLDMVETNWEPRMLKGKGKTRCPST